VDRFVDQGSYVYTRAINLHLMYSSLQGYAPVTYPMKNWTREIIYLRPKLFIVYDRTEKIKILMTRTISAVSNTSPIQLTTSVKHSYMDGMSVTITGNTAINGTYTITVVDASNFTLNGTTGLGVVAQNGTVVGTTGFYPTVTWTTGKTPAVVTSPSGTIRYDVQEGTTFKGSITAVYPVAKSTNVRDVGSYGVIHQIQVAAPPDSNFNNFLSVIDMSDGPTNTTLITPIVATGGIQAISVGTTGIVGFVGTLPASYTVPGTASRTHYLAGLTPATTYYLDSGAGGVYNLTAAGPGSAVVSSANGLLVFTASPEGGISDVLAMSTGSLPTASQGVPYSTFISAIGGVSPYTYNVVDTTCPGLTMASSGAVSWPLPTTACSFTARAVDAASAEVQQVFGVNVLIAPPPTPSSITLDPVIENRSGGALVVTVRGSGIKWDSICTVDLLDVGTSEIVQTYTRFSGTSWRQFPFTGLGADTDYGIAARCRAVSLDEAAAETSFLSLGTGVVSGNGTIKRQASGSFTLQYGTGFSSSVASVGGVATIPALPMGAIVTFRICHTSCGEPQLDLPQQ
jgi:hypothetical protein